MNRIEELKNALADKRLDQLLICDQANIRALTGVECDAACLNMDAIYTDFRYVAMIHRVAPWLKVRDIRRLSVKGRRIGYESSISHARFLHLRSKAEKKATFVDISEELAALRMTKTADEIEGISSAERLNVAIWNEAKELFKAGMTEREMAVVIKRLMIERGDGEAFDTIVCVGANAAECHHRPDDTVWNGREPVLVDMGVKLGGYCSDLTRNLVPKNVRGLYRKVYALVEQANRAAIAAVRPGMTAAKLDKVARDIIKRGGFGKCFGHSLGHGVGYEIHEAPAISPRGRTVLKPGMVFTIEPGIYLEGNLGVRIEDMVLVTEDGCKVLSA
jgi:Xaa-Pro aminopeptidase/Xaa-Pro dipeptidase